MYVNYAAGEDPLINEGDVIFVRGITQYHLPRVVSIFGEVLYPGKYSIEVGPNEAYPMSCDVQGNIANRFT